MHGQRGDQGAVLGERDELVRPDEPETRVPPADQRLDAVERPRRHVHLRLVPDVQGPVGDRRAQVREQAQPGRVAAVELGSVELQARPARLGRVHGEVRATHQVGAVAARCADGDPHAPVDRDRDTVEVERAGQRVPDPLGPGPRLTVGGPGEQHRELVAAEAGDQRVVEGHAEQPLRHQGQQPVPGLVAEGVVDVLEAVEVHEQHGRGPGRHRLLEPGAEQPAVGQAGEVVVHGPVLALLGLADDEAGPQGVLDRDRGVVAQRLEPADVGRGEGLDVSEHVGQQQAADGVALVPHRHHQAVPDARALQQLGGLGARAPARHEDGLVVVLAAEHVHQRRRGRDGHRRPRAPSRGPRPPRRRTAAAPRRPRTRRAPRPARCPPPRRGRSRGRRPR